MMPRLRACAIALAAAVAAAAPARAAVQIAFVQPESYSDVIGRDGKPAAAALLDALSLHLERIAGRLVAPNQSLSIEVLDIDLAGQHETRGPNSFLPPRVLRDVTWPKVRLRYELRQDGETLRSGETTVVDYDYLARRNSFSPDDPLRFEKQMLADWFRAEFGAPASAGPGGGNRPAFAFGPSGGGGGGGNPGPQGIGYGGSAGGGSGGGGSGGGIGGILAKIFPSDPGGAPACR